VLLDGELVADVAVTSQTTESFESTITNPALEDLSDAYITFEASTPGQTSWITFGDVSLSAVPEPSACMMGLLGAACTVVRRRRTCASEAKCLGKKCFEFDHAV
jgi:hypothetical protein